MQWNSWIYECHVVAYMLQQMLKKKYIYNIIYWLIKKTYKL